MRKTALGLIETYGYTGAIEAADVCLKAANVSLLACKKVRGGLVTIEIGGDVGAVKAAIDAAEAAVPRVGKLISTHVIPRPSAGLESILDQKKNKTDTKGEENLSIDKSDKANSTPKASKKEEKLDSESEEESKTEPDNDQREDLWNMKVVELRSLARETENIKLSNKDIKYARKEELVNAIAEAQTKGSD
jgi:microcompartment protein CcmL/EutN